LSESITTDQQLTELSVTTDLPITLVMILSQMHNIRTAFTDQSS